MKRADVSIEITESDQGGWSAFPLINGEGIDDAYADVRVMTPEEVRADFLGSEKFVREKTGRIGLLTGIELPESLRNQGIGTAMLLALFEQLRKDGVKVVYTLADNPDAACLYRRLGFKSGPRSWGGNFTAMRLDLAAGNNPRAVWDDHARVFVDVAERGSR